MSNVLTNLISDAHIALDTVSRELSGFVTSVARDPAADRVAIGQTVRIAQTPRNTAGTPIVPQMALPSAADQEIGNKVFTISKLMRYPFSWSGEEQKAVNTGPGFLTIKQDQIAQAFRSAINDMESDMAVAAKNGASRAYGVAGTTPFATDLKAPAWLKKILDDNGAPKSDRHLCIDTTAGVNMRSLTQLTNVNQAGTSQTLRAGDLLDLSGFGIMESAQVATHTKGTGAGYLTNGAHAKGVTAIAADTGAGTVIAGDNITFAGDTNIYVAKTALAGGSFELNEPGLLTDVADGTAITVGDDHVANIAHTRNSLLLGTRLPAVPEEGDLALDRETITDPMTGIVFDLAVYPGDHMVLYSVEIAWGTSVIKPEHIAKLLG
jgi:hypothetical protein